MGLIVVLSAPSGAGKNALLSALAEQGVSLKHPVSVTTRAPRDGEQHGKDYYFRTAEEFEALLAEGAFVEWAEVHGNRYGTLRAELERCLESDGDVVLELDVQGMRSLRRTGLPVMSVFLAPPSMAVLEERLRSRGTDSDDAIALRLRNAAEEMEAMGEFDHVIVNDELDRAANEMRKFLEAARAGN